MACVTRFSLAAWLHFDTFSQERLENPQVQLLIDEPLRVPLHADDKPVALASLDRLGNAIG